MKYLKGQYLALIAFAALMLTSGCTLDEPAQTSSDPALNLDYAQKSFTDGSHLGQSKRNRF